VKSVYYLMITFNKYDDDDGGGDDDGGVDDDDERMKEMKTV